MRRSRILLIIASVLCISMLMPSCNKLHKIETTKRTKATTEENEDETTPAETEPSVVMDIFSLDQFISDGLFYTEDVALPTPTPIPLVQTALGLTNEDDGYFSGPLQDAVIVDNEFFRYTIFTTEATLDSYVITGEFENKTDIAYKLYLFNPIIDNSCNDLYYSTETIGPHTVVADVTDFTACIPNYDGTEPDRISFIMTALAVDESGIADGSIIATLADSEKRLNYVTCNLYPHGEENFVYEEYPVESGSTIVFDSEEAQYVIEYYEITEKYFVVHYSALNKTSEYLQITLEDASLMLNDLTFSNCSSAMSNSRKSTYVAPFARQTGVYAVKLSDIEEAGMNPLEIGFVGYSLECDSLTQGIVHMWQTSVRQEVVLG